MAVQSSLYETSSEFLNSGFLATGLLYFQANTDILVGVKAELGTPLPEKPDKGRLEFFVDWYVHDMSNDLRKPVLGVSDQVRHKPGCTATEDG